MTDTPLNSNCGGGLVTLPDAVRTLDSRRVEIGAELRATQMVLCLLLGRLNHRRAIPSDFALAARAAFERIPPQGEPFDTAFAETVTMLLAQIESPGNGKPRHPKPKLTVVGKD